MIGTGRHLATILVLSVGTILSPITTLMSIQTECILRTRSTALELRTETLIIVAIFFIRLVTALILTVANRTRTNAFVVVALELARFAGKRRTIIRFVAVVTAIILFVTLPVVRDTLERGLALELSRRAVRKAGLVVCPQDEIIRTGTLVTWGFRR